jgi:hypothetical protein
MYTASIPDTFGLDVDFAQLVKLFGDYGQHDSPDARYSPPRIMEVISKVRTGNPDRDHISTSFVERQNLTMRMAIRRFTRPDKRFQQETAESENGCRVAFRLLQFLPRPFQP